MDILKVDPDYDFAPTGNKFEDLPEQYKEAARKRAEAAGFTISEDQNNEENEAE